MLYFVFLLFAAAFGLIGYAEIEAIGKGWLSSAFLLISIALLIITFSSISLKPREFGFGVLYGIFSTLIPLMLTVSVLITNKTALWKALLPLGVPVCSILAYPLTTSAGFPVGASMPALGWGLLGIVAYQGRK